MRSGVPPPDPADEDPMFDVSPEMQKYKIYPFSFECIDLSYIAVFSGFYTIIIMQYARTYDEARPGRRTYFMQFTTL